MQNHATCLSNGSKAQIFYKGEDTDRSEMPIFCCFFKWGEMGQTSDLKSFQSSSELFFMIDIMVYLSRQKMFDWIAFWVKWKSDIHPSPPLLCLVSLLEPKAQVSFSDQNLSVVRYRCPSRRRWFRKLFTFSSSSQEPLGHLNQIWHKASLGKGDLSWFKF